MKEREVDAFIWVINATNLRMDGQTTEFFGILEGMFGVEFIENLVIVLSKLVPPCYLLLIRNVCKRKSTSIRFLIVIPPGEVRQYYHYYV